MTTATELERLVIRLVGDGSDYKKTLDDAERATKKAAKGIDLSLKGMVNGLGNGIKSVGSTLRSLGSTMTMGVTLPIVGAGLAAVKLAADLETVTTQFRVMLGTANGDKMLANLREFAKVTPFGFEQTAKSAKTLLAFGVDQKRVLPVMKMVGDVAAGTGAELSTMATIFGQVKGMGKLQGQDFMQLVNAGFDVSMIAKVMETDMKGLKDMMEDGKVPFEAVQEAFRRMTSEGGMYNNMMETMSKTAAGAFSNLMDDATMLAQSFGQELLPVAKELLAWAAYLVGWFKELDPEVKRQIIYAAALAAAMGPVIWAFGMVATAIGSVVTVGMLWTVIAFGIGAALLAVTDTLGMTETGFGNLFDSIRIFGTGLGTWIALIGNVFARGMLFMYKMAQDSWAGIKIMAESTLRVIYGAILVFARIAVTPFQIMANNIVAVFNGIIEAYNLVAKKLGASPIEFRVSVPDIGGKIDKLQRENMDALGGTIGNELDGYDQREKDYKAQSKFLEDDAQRMLHADGFTDTGAIGFDKERAMAGLNQVMDNVKNMGMGLFDKLKGFLPNMPTLPKAPEMPKGPAGTNEIEKWDKSMMKQEPGKMKKDVSFEQIALNRISLAGLTGNIKKKNEVSAPGVENKLDQLISIAKDSKKQAVPVVGN